MIKCVFCDRRSTKGAHDVCWKEFKGFMLSTRVSLGTNKRDETLDEFNPTGQNYVDRQGRVVVQGKVVIPDYLQGD